ncbi:MAG: signal recognition particle protein [Nitrososphaerota archaeon]|jgi:signal recognition particle subunit SRP54|nr:signal recognition particle receptor subunit alpha [Nitrososphaerota archaeon]MDG6903850.1 signal recognition particle protein [Nitrososphaerota archaeon]MDG6911518.1 signal recognition particle protein [Nitrososphaerota archaeon]MDG6940420.1 signal recognition particle protein [Nitrososphaerota archaeon]MDG6960734.1 signal recognition particle protein [Nitrososphaerota archaeon]
MLDSLREGLQSAVRKLVGANLVDERAVKEFVRDLQRALIQSDVNVRIALEVTERVQKRALEEKPPAGVTKKDQIVSILYEELARLLGGEGGLPLSKERTNVLVMLGVQGSGKTTTTAKLARLYSRRGFKVGVVAADTFRPGAVAQLKALAAASGVEVYSDEKEKDSVKIAKAGKAHFEGSKNMIIIDTAGRHKEEKGLLQEMKDVVSGVKPDATILVIDGTIGQQCYSQALAFHQAAPVGGIVVTKLDGAAKGGGALAASAATGAKVFFIGAGERIDDLEEFVPTRFVGRLLGMGDLKALMDMVRESEVVVDEKMTQRVMSGKMTMNDLLVQFEQMKKFGSLKKILEHIPGFSGQVDAKELDKAEDRVKVYRSIIQSMTGDEKNNPETINASRLRRIAKGSGRSEKDVRELLSRYKQMKTLVKTSKGREMRQMMRRMGEG